MPEYLNEYWDPNGTPWIITEGEELQEGGKSPEVDGKTILAKVEGQFFEPDGISRNKRFYPRDLWEDTLADGAVQARLKGRMMFGCIGHVDRPVSEEDIQEGRVSHIVTKLRIDPSGHGMGEALILNTPSGRNLFTVMKAKSELRTSSRARGGYLEGQKKDGNPIVDKASYRFETFDFVLNPGMPNTTAHMSESLTEETEEMEKYLEELVRSRDELQRTLTSTMGELQGVTTEKDALATQLAESVKKLNESIAQLESAIELTKSLGFDGITEMAEKMKGVTPELLEAAKSVEDLPKSLAKLEEYQAIGEPDEIDSVTETSADLIEAYQKLGTVEELTEAIDASQEALEQYTALGTVDELAALHAKNEEAEKEAKDAAMEATVEKLSTRYKTPVENVRKMLEVMDEAVVAETLSGISGVAQEEALNEDGDPDAKSTPKGAQPSRAGKLFETMTKTQTQSKK